MKKFHYYILTLAYMSFIAYMSLIRLNAPGEHPSVLKQAFHNFLHIPTYALLAFLWIKCLGVSGKSCVGADLVSARLIYAALVTIAYGILMEYLQSLTAYRSASFMDVCSNTLGTGIVVAFYLWRRQLQKGSINGADQVI